MYQILKILKKVKAISIYMYYIQNKFILNPVFEVQQLRVWFIL